MGLDSAFDIHGRYGNRIPVGKRISTPVQIGPGAHSVSYTMGAWSFLGVERSERGVGHPPHLALRLKKEKSYTIFLKTNFLHKDALLKNIHFLK